MSPAAQFAAVAVEGSTSLDAAADTDGKVKTRRSVPAIFRSEAPVSTCFPPPPPIPPARTPGWRHARHPAIEVQHLTKRYATRHTAVSDLSLTIARGETVALLGPNGAGKSTTVEVLEGFRSRTSGDVRVLGSNSARATGATHAHKARPPACWCSTPPVSAACWNQVAVTVAAVNALTPT